MVTRVCFECLIGKQKKPILSKVTGRESGRRKREKDALWRKKKKEKRGELALIAMDVQSRGQRMEGGRRACV